MSLVRERRSARAEVLVEHELKSRVNADMRMRVIFFIFSEKRI